MRPSVNLAQVSPTSALRTHVQRVQRGWEGVEKWLALCFEGEINVNCAHRGQHASTEADA